MKNDVCLFVGRWKQVIHLPAVLSGRADQHSESSIRKTNSSRLPIRLAASTFAVAAYDLNKSYTASARYSTQLDLEPGLYRMSGIASNFLMNPVMPVPLPTKYRYDLLIAPSWLGQRYNSSPHCANSSFYIVLSPFLFFCFYPFSMGMSPLQSNIKIKLASVRRWR